MAFSGPEENSKSYAVTLVTDKATNTPLELAAINSATLTLKDVASGTIINSRSAQNILNANNVTIHASSGQLLWEVQPDDMVIVDQNKQIEEHEATFEVLYSSSTKKLKWAIRIRVTNLQVVT